MGYDYKTNQEAIDNPLPGDYWHERFCPYFLVVNVYEDKITVLNCLDSKGPNSMLMIDGGERWTFDVTKAMVVDREWLELLVKYKSMDGFCADVVRGRCKKTVDEWVHYRSRQLIGELKSLGPEVSMQILRETW